MAPFLLIHGSCHGAWCWRDVLPLLRAAGHQARAIDLPSHGDDPSPAAMVTLEQYAGAILAALDAPAIVVGHSMAGFAITAAAEAAPERIARLVYLCAYVPRDGASLAEMRREAPRQPLLEAIVTAPDRATFTFDPGLAVARLYHDVAPATAAWAVAQLGAQPIRPQATPIRISDRSASVPRSYIRCSNDRAVPPEHQAVMAADFAPEDRHAMPTSHSPFLADPHGLARLLLQIAETS